MSEKNPAEKLPEVSLEKAQERLFGIPPEVELIKKRLTQAPDEKAKYLNPSTLVEGSEIQRLTRQLRQVGAMSDLARDWNEQIWEPIVFSACGKLLEVNHQFESAKVERLPNIRWLELQRNAGSGQTVALRVLLAVELCRLNHVAIPPAWLRDLYFYYAYGEPTPLASDRADFIQNFLEKFKTYLTNQSFILARQKSEFNFPKRFATTTLVAKYLSLSEKTIEGHNAIVTRELSKHWIERYEPSIIDFLSWDLDLSAIQEHCIPAIK